MKIRSEAARRFMRRAQLLDAPAPDVATVLAHHGYIQIDPINICGRMHDLIARNRAVGYREGDLHRHIHSPWRPGFEHYLPKAGVLAVFPIEAWAYLSGLIASRRLWRGAYGRKLPVKLEKLARRILDEIGERGPLTSDDIEHDGTSMTGWGVRSRLVKNVLESLFDHGRVLITARRNFRRVYDLPERVLPAVAMNPPPLPEVEVERWIVLTKLRQRRLAVLKRDEISLVADRVEPIEIEGCPTLHCLREDVPLFDAGPSADREAPLLLAPLDPLIYDRRLTRSLWGFDYTWEAYLPKAKRKRGHYALPVLAGAQIVGHVEPRADRDAGRLRVESRSIKRGHAVAPAVKNLAGFLGLKT